VSVATEVGARLVPATPVDTGLARGNWRPGLNVPPSAAVTITDPTGAATIARITAVAKLYRPGNTFFLQNNLDYIEDLNRGKSRQAAAGFIAEAVRAGVKAGIARFRGGLKL